MRTGLKGVLLVVLLELGLDILNPVVVGGGVVILPADMENFSSKSAKNDSSCCSVDISLVEDDRLLDHGVETCCSMPGGVFMFGDCEGMR